MSCRNSCGLYIHLAFTYILCWSLKHSVKWSWTSSTFSANDSVWSAMVTGSQSRVSSGPKALDSNMVCRMLRYAYLLEVGLTQNFGKLWAIIHSLRCKNLCRLVILDHFFGHLGLNLLMWSDLGGPWPFRPMWDVWMWRSRAFNLRCEVALRFTTDWGGLTLYHSWCLVSLTIWNHAML